MAYTTAAAVRTVLKTTASVHDTLLTTLIERAQKRIDTYVGFSFEAAADTTRTFDARSVYRGGHLDGRELVFDTWCYSLTSVTNGDGTVIASTYYVTQPRNRTPFYGIKLLASSNYVWESDANADPEGAISLLGRWAYSTAPPADIVHATIRLVTWMYHQTTNQTDIDRPILAEGVLIMPAQLPKDVLDILDAYAWRAG
jgi:hypothetical protein